MYSVNIADGEKTPSRSKPMAKKTQFCENGSAQEKTPTPLAMNFRKEKVSLAMNALRTRAKPCEMPITMDMRLRKR